MNTSIAAVDTPKRNSLQSRANDLRAVLKDFERTYAAENDGRKPSKDVIKADRELSGKYKEYNKIRDVLAGKLGIEALDVANSPKRRKSTVDSEGSLGRTPQKKRVSHPAQIDPYDAPPSTTPKPTYLSAIGPTPQRDGQIFGIFDLLSHSGSGRSSQATPSSKKRKFNALDGKDRNVDERPTTAIAQTPTQRRTKASGDLLEHLSGDTPTSGSVTGRQKHSRTPVSDGKKFMLSQIFATPSAVRFAKLVDGVEEAQTRAGPVDSTPLRNRVLGLSPMKTTEQESHAPDATPAYLKRSYSFKDRLLSASGSASHSRTSSAGVTSPTTLRSGTSTLWHPKFMPKPLSQIVSDMRKLEDQQHDDDLDALREMEGNEVNTLVDDSQIAKDNGQNNNHPPARVWKKKGQKRTTRRSVMRPAKMRAKDEPKFVAADDDDDEEDGEQDMEDADGEISRVEETQLNAGVRSSSPNLYADLSEDELQADAEPPAVKPSRRTKRTHSHDGDNDNDEIDDDFDEFIDNASNFDDDGDDDGDEDEEGDTGPSKSKAKKSKHSPAGNPAKASSKQKDNAKAAQKKKKPATINPNAHSHMNFRSLKIRNKNSKAKGAGRGRFGGGRGRR